MRNNSIGELLRTTDADGYQTTYTYDLLGRMIKRVHPDAGITNFQYDLAGNLIAKQTANLAPSNADIQYIYKFSRLMEIRYPHHPENNVKYIYDSFGRLRLREDGTGSEAFSYDELGNLAQSLRRIVIPTENNAYMFLTRFTYDSFGRMRSIRYPDGEIVCYGYSVGGLLNKVEGKKQGAARKYLFDRKYDAQGRIVKQTYGNNVQTQHVYDPQRQWLSHLSTFSNNTQDWLQDITYQYDAVGNITDIDQSAPAVSIGIGGKYDNHYQYDKQYRLIASQGSGDFTYSFSANYSPTGRFGQKYTATNAFASDLLFGYDKSRLTHQPRTVYDSGYGTMNHFWDANGNLAQIVDCSHKAARLHEWDEENRLRFVLGEKYAGYYGYDANGERVYKLTGSSSMDDVNAGSIKAQAIFDDAVLYPNPYIVVTPKGYTKHYYAGTERLATAIGGGGFLDMQTPIVPLTSQHDLDIVKYFYEYYKDKDPFNYQQIISTSEPTEDIFGNAKPDLEYQCQPVELVWVDVYTSQDILLGSISTNQQVFSEEDDVYFYHGDHLGSANWITDADGKPVQYIHYAPYGEQIANQQTIGYDERFKFTGKERDAETGYDYFGARFYDHRKGIWNSVDPLADKYPGNTPYLYCNGNPIMLVDPDGRRCKVVQDLDGNYHVYANIYYTNLSDRESAQRACNFWNGLKGKTYTSTDGNTHNVSFHLACLYIKSADKSYRRSCKEGTANTYIVVMNLGESQYIKGANISGKTNGNSRVSVARRYQNETTPEHEIGHLLINIVEPNNPNSEHISADEKGIMTPSLHDKGRTNDVNQKTINRVIESNIILKPSKIRQWIHDTFGL